MGHESYSVQCERSLKYQFCPKRFVVGLVLKLRGVGNKEMT